MSDYREIEFLTRCPEDDCNGRVEGSGYANEYGEIVKFIYQKCIKCGWNQAS